MKKFGTFEGVFLPAVLTIIGVMLYLRLGVIVGEIGFVKTAIIIILAHVCTITTALSVASIATNTRMGEGGVYYILSRSLGFEIGGAVGVSIYLTQVFGCAMYIMGFTEIWHSLYPSHDPHVVMTVAFLSIFIVSYISSNLTLKLQYVVFTVIMLSVVSFFLGVFDQIGSSALVVDQSTFKLDTHFWYLFAVFFPAVTGLESGISMSGDLKDPKKSMPIGTITAVFFGFIIYLGSAYLYSLEPDKAKLQDSMYMSHNAYWPSLVVVGMLVATLSSAIGTILAAPRILKAMALDNITPLKSFFSKRNKKGEPTYSLIFSGVLIYLSFYVGDLNKIASLLTMFFLIGYTVLNFGLVLEKVVASPSFRPYFRVPIIIPIIGCVWSLIVSFLIDPVLAPISFLMAVLIYFFILRKHLHSEWGDTRYGFFTMLAEWAVKRSKSLPSGKKNWKPNLLVPVDRPDQYMEKLEFIRDIVFPNGSVRLVSIFINKDSSMAYTRKRRGFDFFTGNTQREKEDERIKEEALQLEKKMETLDEYLKKEGVFSSFSVTETSDFLEGINVTVQVMADMPFPPNIFFLSVGEKEEKDERVSQLIRIGILNGLGIAMLYLDPVKKLGNKTNVNVWLRLKSPNIHLVILISLLLIRNWRATINLISVVGEGEEEAANNFLNKVIENSRLGKNCQRMVIVGEFFSTYENLVKADLNVFGTITNNVEMKPIRKIIKISQGSCLFVKDSGNESAMV